MSQPRTRLLFGLALFTALAVAGAALGAAALGRDIGGTAYLVNGAGMIRGTAQRLAKYALAGIDTGLPAAELAAAVRAARSRRDLTAREDEVLREVELAAVGLAEASARLSRLDGESGGAGSVEAHRGAEGSGIRDEVFRLSEELWFSTNRFVAAVQGSSEARAARLGWLAAALGLALLAAAGAAYLVRTWVAGRLEEASLSDPLTGLPNRRCLELDLARELELAARGGRGLALALMDLDRFKAVNDTWGHAEGDAVLRAVAQAVSRSLRRSDLVYRLGGDEFAILFRDSDSDRAALACEKARLAVSGLGEEGRGVGASLGVAGFLPGRDAAGLLAAADRALYAAKGAGRGRVVVEESPND